MHVHLRGIVMKEEHEPHEKSCEARATCRRGTTGLSGFVPHNFRLYITGVLPRQAADQLHGLFGKGRTTSSAVRVGPALADKRAVPAEDCLRRDKERIPALSGYKSGQERDDGSVRPGEAGARGLAAKHGQLVAQDQDLSIPGHCIGAVVTGVTL